MIFQIVPEYSLFSAESGRQCISAPFFAIVAIWRDKYPKNVDSKVDFRQNGFEKGASGAPFQR